jgi:hypothetical protein
MAIYLIIISGIFNQNHAQGCFSIEVLPGGAAIFPSQLFIAQDGYPEIKFKARYRTESFILPIYYSYRFGYKINFRSNIELEMNHLKVLLDNNPPWIEEFSATHGFNQLWANYNIEYKGFDFRAGVGPVIAHPENIVRGKRFDMHQGFAKKGYYISGITSQFAVQKKLYINNHFFFSVETKLNAAYAKVKITDGYAKFPIFAWNGLIGAGVIF